MIQLNSCQQEAVDGILHAFLKRNAPGFTVIGEGGTGKTTSVMWAIDRFLKAGKRVLFMAPTNKAVKQLEKSARAFGLPLDNVAFMTVHKALGLALLPDEENKFAAQVGKGYLEDFDIACCDEGSMLPKITLLKHLLPRCESAGVKLLAMGDDMQLPPVKESKSLIFDLFPTYRLTQVERQKSGSDILTLTGALRTAIEEDKPFKHIPVGGDVHTLQAAKFLKTIEDHFDADTDLDAQRVLAWSNKRVDQINSVIREKIYGKKANRFEVGERIVTGAPIMGENREIVLSTDEECIVSAVTPSDIYDEDSEETYQTLCLVLKPIHADVPQVFAHVLDVSEEDRYWERLNTIAKKARSDRNASRNHWARYHKFKELFSIIKYCYCITVHRSQGSTYDKVFVDVKNILTNRNPRERRKLLNVAYSRPRSELWINKSGYVA